jgi:hypothetical protein
MIEDEPGSDVSPTLHLRFGAGFDGDATQDGIREIAPVARALSAAQLQRARAAALEPKQRFVRRAVDAHEDDERRGRKCGHDLCRAFARDGAGRRSVLDQTEGVGAGARRGERIADRRQDRTP